MEVVVTGIGCISALGSLETTWKRLLGGQSGVQHCQPFPELESRPLALIAQLPANFIALTQQVVAATLEDAGLGSPLPHTGIVIGSSRGQQAMLEQSAQERAVLAADREPLAKMDFSERGTGHSGDFCQHSSHWFRLLPHAAAVATAEQIGATGPVLAPMAACATGLWAIAQGYELLQTRQCQRVLVGAVETPITPLIIAGFKQIGVLARTGAYPFDCRREGLALGEGAAMLVLETGSLARHRGARVYGRILGFGFTADGYHISAPDPQTRGAMTAVQQCLQRSGLLPEKIDYIHAHGTGTRLNDQQEADLIQQLFPPSIPVSSSKGAIGHTLGASGTIGVALSLMALNWQVLPPCVGLHQPAFGLNLVTTATPRAIDSALCLSFGFGGQNAALALGQL